MSPIETKRTPCEVYSRVTGYLHPCNSGMTASKPSIIAAKRLRLKIKEEIWDI